MANSRLIENQNFNHVWHNMSVQNRSGVRNVDGPLLMANQIEITNTKKSRKQETIMCKKVATGFLSNSVKNYADRILNWEALRFIREIYRMRICKPSQLQVNPGYGIHSELNPPSDKLLHGEISKSTVKSPSRLAKTLFGMSVLGIAIALNTLVALDVFAQQPSQMRIGWLDDNGTPLDGYTPDINRYDNQDYYVGYEKHLEYSGSNLPAVEALTSIWNIDTTFRQTFNGAERLYNLTDAEVTKDNLDDSFTEGTEVNKQDSATSQNAVTLPNPFNFSAVGNSGKVLGDDSRYFSIGENFKYGTWYIQLARYNNCGTLHRAGDGFCRNFYFDPNESEIAKLKTNQVVRSRLNINYGDVEKVNNFTRHVIVRLTRSHHVDVEWTDESEGNLLSLGPNGVYDDLEGLITVDSLTNGKLDFSQSSETNPMGEVKNYDAATSLQTSDVITIADFPGDESVVGEDFVYGKWIIERQGVHSTIGESTFKIRFRPGVAGLASIPAGETATSTLTLNFSVGQVSLTTSITAEIRGSAIPVVSFANNRQTVLENGDSHPGRLLVTSSIMPRTNKLTLNYTLTNSVGNFFTGTMENSKEVEFLQASIPNTTRYYGFINVPIEDNVVDNPVGQIQARLTTGSGYVVSASSNTVVLEVMNDDISVISIAIDPGDTDFTEGSGTGPRFTISADKIRSDGKTINVYYAVNQGENDFVNNDFLETGNFVVLPAGNTNVTTRLVVGIDDDSIIEDAGSVIVTLQLDPSDGNAYTISQDSSFATFQVLDNEPIAEDSIGLNVVDAKIKEGDDGETTDMVFRVTLTVDAPSGGVTYSWSTSDGTATVADGDFDGVTNGTGTVKEGEREDTFIVQVNGDDKFEFDENFSVTVTSTANNVILRDATAIGTIENDDENDVATPTISITGKIQVMEGSDAVFTISADATRIGFIDVYYSVNQGNNDFVKSEFLEQGKFVRLPAGEASVTAYLVVGIDDDSVVEASGNVTVSIISQPRATQAYEISQDNSSVTIEVRDNDRLPDNIIGLSVTGSSVQEGDEGVTTNLEFTVRLTEAAPAGGVSYSWSTLDGTATKDNDYVAVSNGSGLVLEGQTTDTFTVQVNGDDVVESDETLSVTVISTARNVSVTHATTEGRILNDDVISQEVVLSIAANGPRITEGKVATFTVSSNQPVESDLRVNILVSVDGNFLWFGVPSSATISASANNASYTVQTTADPLTNDDGSITVRIGSSVSYNVNPSQMEATIMIDDDGAPIQSEVYSVASNVITSILQGIPATEAPGKTTGSIPQISVFSLASSVNEGGIARFEIRVDPVATNALSVQISVADDGNRISSGHVNRSLISISAGVSVAPLEFPTENDDHAGEDSAISVSIINGNGYEVDGSNNSAEIKVSDFEDRNRRSDQVTSASQESLPYLFGLVNLESLGETNRRMQTAYNADRNSSLTIAGQSTIEGILQTGMEVLDKDALSKSGLFWDESEFSIAIGPDYFGNSMATVWGAGNYKLVTGQELQSTQKLDSGILTRQIGIDARLSRATVVGLTAFVSESDSKFESNGFEDLDFTGETTGVHSYLGWESKNGTSQIDVISGFGANHLAMKQPGYERESLENNFYSVFAGGETTLLSFDDFVGRSIIDLKSSVRFWMNRHLSADISNLANDLDLDAHHVLFAASGSGYKDLANGDRVSLILSLGLRNDGKGENSADAFEAFSRINYIGQYGLNLSGSSGLIQFDGTDSQSLTLKGSLEYDQGTDQVGNIAKVSTTLKPLTGEETDMIWSGNELVGNIGSSRNDSSSEAKLLETEFGYGIPVWDKHAILTPYGGLQMDEFGSSEYRIGSRLAAGSNNSFELEGSYHEPENSPADLRIELDGKVRW